MSPTAIGLVAVIVLATSFLSGIFGMAGGMILMGLLLLLLPVPAAMVLHGVAQTASNGWRAVLWRRFVVWPIVGRYLSGSLAALALFSLIRLVPDRAVVFIALGLIPFIGLAVPAAHAPRADRPGGAEGCGFLCSALQLLSGVSGPALDTFFVRTEMDRRAVVATKAACQVISHTTKLTYFGALVRSGSSEVEWPVLVLAVALAMAGTTLSRAVLERLTDVQFRRWTQRLVMGIGVVYLVQGVAMLV